MNCEQAQTCFVDLWRGALEGASRGEVDEHLETCAACRAEYEAGRRYWEALGEMPAIEAGPALRSGFYGALHEWRKRDERRGGTRAWLRHPAAAIAAAALLVGAGIGIGRFTAMHDESRVANLQREVSDMRQLMALSLLEQQSASERLTGVSFASRVEPGDNQVPVALLRALGSDPNVNVRLAAVDALRRFAGDAQVRSSLARALAREESPLVQIALLDALVELGERSSVPSMDRLLREPQLNPEVRERAEWAVKRLQ